MCRGLCLSPLPYDLASTRRTLRGATSRVRRPVGLCRLLTPKYFVRQRVREANEVHALALSNGKPTGRGFPRPNGKIYTVILSRLTLSDLVALSSGSKVRIQSDAFIGEESGLNDQLATVVSLYGPLNRQPACVIRVRKAFQILVPVSSLVEV